MNQVVFGLSWTGIQPPFANASSLIVARASEWMTDAVDPDRADRATGPPVADPEAPDLHQAAVRSPNRSPRQRRLPPRRRTLRERIVASGREARVRAR